jgi:hypothetical protein
MRCSLALGLVVLPDTATRDQLCLPADGPPLLVEQAGAWKPARLVKEDGNVFQIHYLGPRAVMIQ